MGRNVTLPTCYDPRDSPMGSGRFSPVRHHHDAHAAATGRRSSFGERNPGHTLQKGCEGGSLQYRGCPFKRTRNSIRVTPPGSSAILSCVSPVDARRPRLFLLVEAAPGGWRPVPPSSLLLCSFCSPPKGAHSAPIVRAPFRSSLTLRAWYSTVASSLSASL